MVTPFELVTTRHAEDLGWLDTHVSPHWPVTVYNTGEPLGLPRRWVRVVDRPNRGLDSAAILRHLAARWDTLPEVTLFVCGSWRKRPENVLPAGFAGYAAKSVLPDLPLVAARYVVDDGWPGKVKHWGRWAKMLEDGEITPSPFTLGEWWDRVLGGPRPSRLLYAPGQTFSVAAEAVRRRPASWYAALAAYLERSVYPEECHHLERSWVHVFQKGGRRDVDL